MSTSGTSRGTAICDKQTMRSQGQVQRTKEKSFPSLRTGSGRSFFNKISLEESESLEVMAASHWLQRGAACCCWAEGKPSFFPLAHATCHDG